MADPYAGIKLFFDSKKINNSFTPKSFQEILKDAEFAKNNSHISIPQQMILSPEDYEEFKNYLSSPSQPIKIISDPNLKSNEAYVINGDQKVKIKNFNIKKLTRSNDPWRFQ